MSHARVILKSALLLVVLTLAAPSLDAAQTFELTPYIGIKSTGATAVDDQNPIGVNRLEFDRGASYGFGFLYNVHNIVGLEFLWNRQGSQVSGFLPDGTEVPQTIDSSLDQFHGTVHVHTAGVEVATRPYLILGAGATRIGAGDTSSSHLSYTVGLGLKYSFSDRLGARVQGRWTPTYLGNTPEGLFCGALIPTCWAVSEQQVMSQGDFTAGLTFKF